MQALTVGGTMGAVSPTWGLLIGPHTVFWRENSGSHAFTACKHIQGGPTAREPGLGRLRFLPSTILPTCPAASAKFPYISPGRIGQKVELSRFKSIQPRLASRWSTLHRICECNYVDKSHLLLEDPPWPGQSWDGRLSRIVAQWRRRRQLVHQQESRRRRRARWRRQPLRRSRWRCRRYLLLRHHRRRRRDW